MTKKTLYPFYMIIYKSYVKELVIGILVRLASICNKNIALLLPKKDYGGNHVIFCGEKFANVSFTLLWERSKKSVTQV